MLSSLEHFVRQYNLISAGDRVICALSGGADSMALLWGLYLLRDKLSITLEAAHFNHGLRGAESDGDECFVRDFCETFQIPLHCGGGIVTPGKKGLEAAARDARYAFLETLPGKIATAHTANDNAETVLMHLVRGTGLKGLGGISPVRGNIIRPMLGTTREQVLELLKEYHIPYREDSSNFSDQFLRNRLRHHVLPLLEMENPRLAENLSAMALRLREDEQTLQQLVQADSLPPVSQLRVMPPALRSRMLEEFLKRSGVREPEARHLALIEELVFSQKPSARARFPGGVVIGRRYDELKRVVQEEVPEPVELLCPGRVVFGRYQITCCAAVDIEQSNQVFTVTAGTRMIVRGRKSGDSMITSGGTKALKKILIDRKVPAALRDSLPVLVDEEGIVAVYGIGASYSRRAQRLPAWKIIITCDEEDKE